MAAILCGIIALLFFPIILGPAGIALGAVAYARHERLWAVGLTTAIVGMLVGFLLGVLVYAIRH